MKAVYGPNGPLPRTRPQGPICDRPQPHPVRPGKGLGAQAVQDGGDEPGQPRAIHAPPRVATLAVGIVFVAVTFLGKVAKHLFTLLALAEVFAPGTSSLL